MAKSNFFPPPLNKDKNAKVFFETLSKAYRQGYCDWVGSAKLEETKKIRAGNAILILRISRKR